MAHDLQSLIFPMKLPYRFDRYVLLEKVAQGGMAEIFRSKYFGADDFSKEVAIKRLLPVWSENPHFIAMLTDEAKALVALNHPNIVQVFELGRDGKTLFISMEWVEGVDLRKLFLELSQRRQKLPLPFTLFIISEVLKALDYAHNKILLIHRDISPQNILLSFEGQVKLTDFGIAKGSHRSFETTHHQLKGKYSYLSPEQAKGAALGATADLYSLGIVFYELLVGERLFDGVSDLATLEQVRESRIPQDGLKEYPSELEEIIGRALQKNQENRFQSAKEFLEALQPLLKREENKVDAFVFSQFLKAIFPRGMIADEEPVSLKTTSESMSSQKRHWPVWFSALILSLLITISLGWYLSKRYFFPLRKVSPEVVKQDWVIPFPPLQPLSPAPVSSPPIPLLGSVTIEARPQAAEGVLYLGEEKRNFKTPFFWGEIDLSQSRQVKVILNPKRGPPLEETFLLEAQSPHWLKIFEVHPSQPASLSVVAKPWGEVVIPGIVEREAPLRGLSLEEGEYQLRILYPPKEAVLEKKIHLAAGARLFCEANFEENPQLKCRGR